LSKLRALRVIPYTVLGVKAGFAIRRREMNCKLALLQTGTTFLDKKVKQRNMFSVARGRKRTS